MATNYTEHYGLSLWEANDKFYHQEFNENHRKLDAAIHALTEQTETALAGKTDAAATAELQASLNAKIGIVTGSYQGTGGYSGNTSRDFHLGFRPKAVFIGNTNAADIAYTFAIDGYKTGLTSSLTITDDGFHVTANGSTIPALNLSDYTYLYIALH